MATSEPHSDPQHPQYEVFLKLLRQNERRIFGYILSLVPNRALAEDIMQDAIIVMWRKIDEFDPNTQFSAWGMKIARYLVLDFIKKRHRAIVHFDSEALEQLDKCTEVFTQIDDRVEALRNCVKKMSEADKQVIRLRYVDALTIKDTAIKLGRPIHGLYKRLARIHHLLQECIDGTLAAWRVEA